MGDKMELFNVSDKSVKKAIQSDTPYIQVGNRKFLLYEVEDISINGGYEVSDPIEEQKLLVALNDDCLKKKSMIF